jgi:hypothetical protein
MGRADHGWDSDRDRERERDRETEMSSNSEGFVVIDEEGEGEKDGRKDAWDDDDEDEKESDDRKREKAIHVLPPPGPNAYQPPRPKVSLAVQSNTKARVNDGERAGEREKEAVKDDWEEEDEEWEAFLAERRQKALVTGKETVEPYRPRILQKDEGEGEKEKEKAKDMMMTVESETSSPLAMVPAGWNEESDRALAMAIANEYDEDKVAKTIALSSWQASHSSTSTSPAPVVNVTSGVEKVNEKGDSKAQKQKKKTTKKVKKVVKVVNRFCLLDSDGELLDGDSDSD